MTFHAAKLFATIVCALTLFGAAAAPADACCFLNWLFSPCCGSCGPSPCGSASCGPTSYYGPTGCSTGGCSTGSCGTSAYYSPFAWGSASSCGSSCGPCGGGSCASGNCAVSPGLSPASPSPAPATGAPATGAPTGDGDWKKKTEPKTYGEPDLGAPANRIDQDSGFPKSDALQKEGETSAGFTPPAETSGSPIQPAGAEDGQSNPPVRVNPRGKGPQAPLLEDEPEKESGHLPTLNLDEKIAWRPAPERKRVSARPRIGNARLIRVPAYPKSEWTPVDADAKVARN